MSDHRDDLEELTRTVRELIQRVWRLERMLGVESSTDERTQAASPKAVQPPRPASHSPRTPDLESRIGGQWLNRIGIIAVLFGVSFFLKYAFESALIGPAVRVLVGLVFGVGIVAWSEWFRTHGYTVFSFSLKALGLGLLYLSLWASVQVYSLVSWKLAFIAMVVVTVATAILALRQKAEVLAAFALIGGFVTPLLLYTGRNLELDLFTYLLLLNVATAALTLSQGWHRLLLVSLIATMILYFAWYAEFYRPTELPVTLAFATIFFLLFGSVPVLQALSRDASSGGKLVLIAAVLNASIYLFQLYLLIGRSHPTATALVVGVGGLAYIVSGQAIWSRAQNRLTAGLHNTLGVASITTAIAIAFQTHWVSIGWFFEAAVLMAIGFRKESRLVRWQALALMGLAVLKVFLFDIQELSRGYRIISFIALGALLLLVSFAYQRDWMRQFSSRD
jgi:uncharacterized membrane protein